MSRPPKEPAPVCRICGRSLGESLYLSEEGQPYCCERCHLNHVSALPPVLQVNDQGVVEALVTALDVREYETGLRSKRVGCHTLVLARQFTVDPQELTSIYYGALLHYIGKIAIPDRILLKSAPLTTGERQKMQTHPQRGYEILSPVPQLQVAAAIVRAREERFDGQGWPGTPSPWAPGYWPLLTPWMR